MALYFHFNETTGDLVYSDKATYDVEGYVSLGEQTNMNPGSSPDWVFDSQRSVIVTVSKDESIVGKIARLVSMSKMFDSCVNLTSLDLSGFDTSAVLSMTSMLADCNSLTSLDLSDFDTSTVTFMNYMFSGCTSLTSLDLSSFDTSSVTVMGNMFYGCRSLTSLDLSSFDTSSVTSMSSMFSNCPSLRLVTISGKMSNVLSALPAAQYYPAAGGDPVAKASLTAGTWVRDEADLTKVTSIVQQSQMQQALSHRINSLRRDLESQIKEANALLDQLNFATGGLIPIENGGTNAITAEQARANLGITPANIGAATEEELQSVQDSLSWKVTVAHGQVGGTGFDTYAQLVMARSGRLATVTIGFCSKGTGGAEDWYVIDMDKVLSLLGVSGATVEKYYVPLAVADQSDQDRYGGLSGLLMTWNGQVGRRYGGDGAYGSWGSTEDLYKNGGLYATCTFYIMPPL